MSKQRISALLKELGVPVHLLGYGYLRDGVRLVLDRPELVHRITKELYPTIAELHGTTAARVERAIRHAVETSCLRGTPDTQEKYFGSAIDGNKGKPTNGQYIATLADWLRAEGEAGYWKGEK